MSAYDWSVEAVTNWLDANGFSDYTEKFEENEVDGKVLLEVTER
jgi:hypothetical protein